MNKDTNKTKEQLLAELNNLRKKSKEKEDKLKAANQQLEANNQQLQATEQQLRAANQQLEASNKEISRKEALATVAKQDNRGLILYARQGEPFDLNHL